MPTEPTEFWESNPKFREINAMRVYPFSTNPERLATKIKTSGFGKPGNKFYF